MGRITQTTALFLEQLLLVLCLCFLVFPLNSLECLLISLALFYLFIFLEELSQGVPGGPETTPSDWSIELNGLVQCCSGPRVLLGVHWLGQTQFLCLHGLSSSSFSFLPGSSPHPWCHVSRIFPKCFSEDSHWGAHLQWPQLSHHRAGGDLLQ